MHDNDVSPLETFLASWSIERTIFVSIIEQLLGQPLYAFPDGVAHEIRTGASTSPVYRIHGLAQTATSQHPWSLIFKVVQAPQSAPDDLVVSDWYREVQVYQSTFLEHLPAQLQAPHCYHIVSLSPLQFGLWLEEITETITTPWPLEHYGIAAYHLGHLSATFCDRPTQATWPWIPQDWLRQQVERAGPQTLALLKEYHHHPLIGQIYPPPIAEAIVRLWDDHVALLAALARFPQTVCHNDAFRRNLFARMTEQGTVKTVLIDWSSIGLGAVGQELGSLLAGSLDFGAVEVAQAEQLDALVFTRYVDGLQEAGWRDDPRKVRMAYTVSAPLLYELCYTVPTVRYLLSNEIGISGIEQIVGQSIEALIQLWNQTITFRLKLADEARALYRSMS
jgi:hypothetical protein